MRTLATGGALLALVAWCPRQASAQTLHVGEIRRLALARSDSNAVTQLHNHGWIEARGQLLTQQEFPELFTTIGESFSTRRVAPGKFALPDLEGVTRDSRNPYNVLSAADLLTSRKASDRLER